MAIEYKTHSYMSGKHILAIPDHYVAIAQTIEKADPIAATVGSKKIVKAGTIYPSNDGKAIGVVMNDYDVTDGDAVVAVIIHGFIQTDKLPAPASAEAKAALKQITFLPITTE